MALGIRTIGVLAGIVIGLVIAATVTPKQHSAPISTTFNVDGPDSDEQRAEARAIALTEGLVTRQARTITISRNGRAIAQYSDPVESCASLPCGYWLYFRTVRLQDSIDTLTQSYPVLVYSNWGGGGNPVIVGENGEPYWFDFQTIPQDGGRLIASGIFDSVETNSHFYIVDWASPQHRTAWKSDIPCEPLRWQKETVLLVACQKGAKRDRFYIAATVSQTPDTNWHLRQIGTISGEDIVAATTGRKYTIKTALHGEHLQFDLTPFVFTPVTPDRNRQFGYKPLP